MAVCFWLLIYCFPRLSFWSILSLHKSFCGIAKNWTVAAGLSVVVLSHSVFFSRFCPLSASCVSCAQCPLFQALSWAFLLYPVPVCLDTPSICLNILLPFQLLASSCWSPQLSVYYLTLYMAFFPSHDYSEPSPNVFCAVFIDCCNSTLKIFPNVSFSSAD